jgi:hypothetical protein
MPAEPKLVTNGPLRDLAEMRAGTGFAWSCRAGHAENGELAEIHQITSGDRDEYERHMRGHGFKPPSGARQPWKPWSPPRPASEYKPEPMDPGQRAEWVKVTEAHHENPGYLADDGTYVPPSGAWMPQTRQARTGVIWSVADTASAWWVQPDEAPAHPVYVKRAGKRDRWHYHEGELYEVPGTAEVARTSAIRAETIRKRGIFPVIDSQSADYGSYHPAGTNRIHLAWHSDPKCPRAAGKNRYDPDSRPQGIVYGYQPEGRAVRPLGQPRWTVLDVADALVSGEQPPSCLCQQCITGLDVAPPATLDDHPSRDEEDDMTTTRRLDGKPETPADTRFFDLRERGYTGPIDQDGHAVISATGPDGAPLPLPEGGTGRDAADDPNRRGWAAARATASQGGTTSVMTRLAIGLGLPDTDGKFLQSCAQLGEVLRSLAGQISDWADGLAALNLPASVLDRLLQASGRLTDAADGMTKATAAFEEEFDEARDIASRGMRVTGQDAG